MANRAMACYKANADGKSPIVSPRIGSKESPGFSQLLSKAIQFCGSRADVDRAAKKS